MDFEKICGQVCSIAQKAGDFIRNERKEFKHDTVIEKSINNFVTYVDKCAEEIIVNGLTPLIPDAGFITEEGTAADNGARYRWVIDPLDGTTNYIHGLAPYAVSIALIDNNQPVIGVVLEINTGECFYAWKDSPAFLNGKTIKVSEAASVSDSLIATGFPYYDYARVGPFLESLNHFFRNSHGVRRLGSAATDLAYVACGRFEAFYEYGLSPWDVAAGALIVSQAGGRVSDFSQGNNYIFGREIIATNKNVYRPFANIINQIFIK